MRGWRDGEVYCEVHAEAGRRRRKLSRFRQERWRAAAAAPLTTHIMLHETCDARF